MRCLSSLLSWSDKSRSRSLRRSTSASSSVLRDSSRWEARGLGLRALRGATLDIGRRSLSSGLPDAIRDDVDALSVPAGLPGGLRAENLSASVASISSVFELHGLSCISIELSCRRAGGVVEEGARETTRKIKKRGARGVSPPGRARGGAASEAAQEEGAQSAGGLQGSLRSESVCVCVCAAGHLRAAVGTHRCR